MKEEIKIFLKENMNEKKAEFDRKIIKTNLKVLGVKTSSLSTFAKYLAKNEVELDDFDFICHEEVLLAGMMIGYKKCKSKEKICLLEKIMPYFDNWAVVDTIIPRFKKMEGERGYFESLLFRQEEFVKRTGIIFLMKFILPFDLKGVVKKLQEVIDEQYYVNMAISWCYAEAFIKDFDFMNIFLQQIGDRFVRNMTIKKACESFRLTREEKDKILKLKI